jgi:signal peptidase II
MKKIIQQYIIIISIILLDFITKIIFLNKQITFTNFFYISTVINTGTISGILSGLNTLFIITTIITIGILIYLYKKEKRLRFGLNMIIAGAIGNLTSRIIYGGVIDFIYLYPFGTFNLADIFIDIGLIMCIYKTIK